VTNNIEAASLLEVIPPASPVCPRLGRGATVGASVAPKPATLDRTGAPS
jgi:hypothetical protein